MPKIRPGASYTNMSATWDGKSLSARQELRGPGKLLVNALYFGP